MIGQAHLNCIHQACLFISSMFVPENNLIHYKKREKTSYCLLYFVVHIVFSMYWPVLDVRRPQMKITAIPCRILPNTPNIHNTVSQRDEKLYTAGLVDTKIQDITGWKKIAQYLKPQCPPLTSMFNGARAIEAVALAVHPYPIFLEDQWSA